MLGEEADEAGIGPEEHDEAFCFQTFFEHRLQFLADVIHLLQCAKGLGDGLEPGHRRLNLREARGRHHRGLQLAQAHAAHHVGLAAHGAIGVNRQLHTAARRRAPLFAHGLKMFGVGRAFRGQRPHPHLHRFGAHRVIYRNEEP